MDRYVSTLVRPGCHGLVLSLWCVFVWWGRDSREPACTCSQPNATLWDLLSCTISPSLCLSLSLSVSLSVSLRFSLFSPSLSVSLCFSLFPSLSLTLSAWYLSLISPHQCLMD